MSEKPQKTPTTNSLSLISFFTFHIIFGYSECVPYSREPIVLGSMDPHKTPRVATIIPDMSEQLCEVLVLAPPYLILAHSLGSHCYSDMSGVMVEVVRRNCNPNHSFVVNMMM